MTTAKTKLPAERGADARRAYEILAAYYSEVISPVVGDGALDIELLENYDLSRFFNLKETVPEFFAKNPEQLRYLYSRRSYSDYFTRPIVLFCYVMGALHPEYTKAGWRGPEGVLVSVYADLGYSYEATFG